MNKIQLETLLATVRSYLILARAMRSSYYFNQAQTTLINYIINKKEYDINQNEVTTECEIIELEEYRQTEFGLKVG